MSINTDDLTAGIRGGSLVTGTVTFDSLEVDLGGVRRHTEVEVSIDGSTEYVTVGHYLEGEEEVDVEIDLENVIERIQDADLEQVTLGALLHHLDHEDCLRVVQALASARMAAIDDVLDTLQKVEQTAACDNNSEGVAEAQARMDESRAHLRRWEAIHAAATQPETAETAETVSDVTVTEMAPEPVPEPPDVGVLVTPETLESHSSVKETVKSILANEDDRLLLIGLLVESGYIVGKKVV